MMSWCFSLRVLPFFHARFPSAAALEKYWTIRSDKHSAVVNNTEIAETLRLGDGTAELFVEWDVTP